MTADSHVDPPVTESRLRRRLKRFWPVIPLLAILFALMLSDLGDFMGYSPFSSNPCDLKEIDQSGLSASIYMYLAGRVLHAPAVSTTPGASYPNVSIVTIDANTAPPGLLTNACQSRKFVARLVHDLNLLSAAVIVIDKYYSTDYCPATDTDNQSFLSGLAATRVPVVLGRPTHALADTSSECLALSSPLLIPNTAKVTYGLTRLNADDLKIPLHWPVFNDPPGPPLSPIQPAISLPEQPAAAPTPAKDADGNGLALVAAETYRPSIAKADKLTALLTSQIHPYTSFINLANFNAMAVLCNAEPTHKYAIDPSSPAASPLATPQPLPLQSSAPDLCDQWVIRTPNDLAGLTGNIAGKVVVIGDLSDADMQPFPGGDKPGVFLQANYVQSILDQRFLVEIPIWITVALLVLFVISVYCLYWSHDVQGQPHLSPEQAGVASAVALLVLVGISLGALHFLYYTPIWALWGGGVFVVFRYLEASGHHRSQHLLGHLTGHHKEHPAEHASAPTEAPIPPPPASEH